MKASIELGVSSDQLEIQVVSEGSSGFFGIGSKPAIIKARRIEDDSIDKEFRQIVETVSASSLKDSSKDEDSAKAAVKEEKKNKPKASKKKESADASAQSQKANEKEAASDTGSDADEASAFAAKKKASGKKNERRQDKKGPDRKTEEPNSSGTDHELEASEVKASGRKRSRRKNEGEMPEESVQHLEAEEPISVEEFEERRERRSRGRHGHDRGRGSKDYDRRSHERRSAYSEPLEEEAEAADQVEEAVVKPPKPSKPIKILTDPDQIAEVESRALVFLTDVFACMDLGEVKISSHYNSEEGSLDVDFEGEDMGMLIGKRGQTLDSLQYLTSLVVNKGKEDYVRVKLDTEDYRRRRKETLENLARGIAYKVKKTRRPVVLEPMNPYERRIIHSALQSSKYVETMSEGEEPYRHVVVKLKKF